MNQESRNPTIHFIHNWRRWHVADQFFELMEVIFRHPCTYGYRISRVITLTPWFSYQIHTYKHAPTFLIGTSLYCSASFLFHKFPWKRSVLPSLPFFYFLIPASLLNMAANRWLKPEVLNFLFPCICMHLNINIQCIVREKLLLMFLHVKIRKYLL